MADTLRDSLIDEIKDIYNAEKQLTKALPKLAKAATNPELRTALEDHLAETQNQIARLEEAFELLDEKPRGKHCAGMAGIIEEGADLLEEHDKGALLDANIIAAGQRSEHYEISAYGTVIAWAEALDLGDVARLLTESLEEEKAADQNLSALAEAGINEVAKLGEDGEEDGGEDDAEAGGKKKRGGAAAGAKKRKTSTSGRR